MPIMSGKKCLGSQAKEVVARVYHHIKKEKFNGVLNLTNAMWRTVQATGYSECVINSILKEIEEQHDACKSADGTEETKIKTSTLTETAEETKMAPTNDITEQTKVIIARVYQHMKKEAEIVKLIDPKSPSRRAAKATGYSQRTIFKVLKEEQQAWSKASTYSDTKPIFKPPTKRRRICPKSTLDNYDLSLLRQTIISYLTKNHKLPTLKQLLENVTKKIDYKGCKESFRKIVYDAGFEWSGPDNHKVLVERHDVQMFRFRYLKQLQKYRDEGRYIVFTDNYCVDSTSMQKKLKNENGTAQKRSKGIRVIIIHAGGSQGFVQNACLIYEANPKTDESMNFKKYKKWLTNQLLPNLPENAVIVMTNENCVFENCPNPNSTKSFMHAWLTEQNIEYEETMNKVELYDLVLKGQATFKSHTIEELVRSKGFPELRLPPHHPDLNPMEHIWRALKTDEVLNNVEEDLTSNLNLIKERIEMIDRAVWEDACRQVIEAEKQYIKYFDNKV
ncbi:uncharacterized protein LOC125242146 [Leguminivora glycinivorella]|uniref:uncharacterized protein LOC125242146 n=1 Tax=Leguminivora glycinivorella TaxID=1035111 RepID=UPI00200D4F68|nr:uncharacterized protein LOC125242146 [Leguminivora glycinivorella]